MKKKNETRNGKLELNKTIITKLSQVEMTKVVGGVPTVRTNSGADCTIRTNANIEQANFFLTQKDSII